MGKLPASRKGAKNLPQEDLALEEALLRCPNAHLLPHDTGHGQCTSFYCGDGKRGMRKPKDKRLKKVKEGMVELKPSDIERAFPTTEPTPSEELMDAQHRISGAAARLQARRAFLKVPEGLKGEDAENYVTSKLVDLTPDAVAEYEFQLKLGDDKQRMEAASRIMDATGHGKRDRENAGSSPILLLTGVDVNQLPWALKKPEKLVEGQVTAMPMERK